MKSLILLAISTALPIAAGEPSTEMLDAVHQLHARYADPAEAAAPGKDRNAASGRSACAWTVTLQGTVQGRPFTRPGTLVLADPVSSQGTSNGQNPLEVLIVSGSPAISPSVGAIQYFTNTFFTYLTSGTAPSAAQLDVAYVSTTDTKVVVQPDSRISLGTAFFNIFNAASGITANIYQVTSGQLDFQFTDDFKSVDGNINIVGSSYFFYGTSPYVAKVKGTLLNCGTLPY